MLNTSNALLLEKLIYLGKKLERLWIFELLDPWYFDCFNTIELQNAAKKISSFIGLPYLTFVINFVKQDENVAGHIELNNNSDNGVFIEIDEKYRSNCGIVLAILAHEICHKLIHISGLSLIGYENEILTDVATIYVGLGKLSLNGCQTETTSFCKNLQGENENKTIYKTTVGYLSRDQFGFLYDVVCNMRRIPSEYATKGLSKDSVLALSFKQYTHDEELYFNYSLRNKLVDLQDKYSCYYLKESAELNKRLKLLLLIIDDMLQRDYSMHKRIMSESKSLLEELSENLFPERLNYLKNILVLNKLEKLGYQYEEELDYIKELNVRNYQLYVSTEDLLNFNLLKKEKIYDVKCPVCGNILIEKQNKLVKVKCTKCMYIFMVDNSLNEVQIRKIKPNSGKMLNNNSLLDKIKRIIAIIKE